MPASARRLWPDNWCYRPLFVRRADSRIIWSFAGAHALARYVGCDFEAVPTQLHAAPAPGSLFARVIEMQYALSAPADTGAIHIAEQHRRAVRQGGKQIFGPARFEPQLRRGCASIQFVQLGTGSVNPLAARCLSGPAGAPPHNQLLDGRGPQK
jgi:hypothetical protein